MNPREEFNLGFDGEYWVKTLYALAIPVPGVKRSVLVLHSGGVYKIVGFQTEMQAEDLLMAAAMVQNFIDNYGTANRDTHGKEALVEDKQ